MQRKLFGTDGIRGEANTGFMTPEVAFRLGAAVTHLAKAHAGGSPRVILGKDTRLSGYMFETAIASGVCAMGGRVMLCMVVPTPAVAYLTTSMRADAGIVISASHNPYQDNGIKIFGRDGFKLDDTLELEIERLIDSHELDRVRARGLSVGRAERIDDAKGRYVTFVKSSFPNHLSLEGVRIVVDAGHGAAYGAAPSVFAELGATVFTIGGKPNGRNINDQCGALHPEACAAEVKRRKADIGIALDGDADRLIVLDNAGKIVDGDAILALCAIRMLAQKKLNKRTLVATVMSNLGLERAMTAHGGKLARCGVGDRYVVELMRNKGYNLGGEQSGHIIFLEHSTTGDGLIAALQLLAAMLEAGKPLSELAQHAIQRVPQVLVNLTLPDRRPLAEMTRTAKATLAAEKKLGKEGRVLVRWSGTEPKLRVMIEGPNEKQIRSMAEGILEEAKRDIPAKN